RQQRRQLDEAHGEFAAIDRRGVLRSVQWIPVCKACESRNNIELRKVCPTITNKSLRCPMDEAVRKVISEYEPRLAAETALMQSIDASQMRARRDEFLLPIGPDTAQVLHTLIKGAKSRSILELGTSYGYSTLWLADAARHTDGKVVSLELAPDKAQFARASLARAGVADRVDIQVGN